MALGAAFALSLSAATKIDDPKTFVTQVYRRMIASSSYSPPEDFYTPRLKKLILDDRRKAGGEVGCLEINFWVNAQDYKISHLVITTADESPERQTVIAKFHNITRDEEIRFDFRKSAEHWLLDDVHSKAGEPWTLSEILKCAP